MRHVISPCRAALGGGMNFSASVLHQTVTISCRTEFTDMCEGEGRELGLPIGLELSGKHSLL